MCSGHSRGRRDCPRATLDLVTRLEWRAYLERFHTDKAGITETVLRAGRADGVTPYEWLGSSLEQHTGVVVDVACGSGPMQPIIGAGWLGLDRSLAELAAARHACGEAPLIRADAIALPLRAGVIDALVWCMSLMVFPSIEGVLRELGRVAAPRARLGVLLPATSPLTTRDRLRYGKILATLRIATVPYPNPRVVKDPSRVLRAAGFAVKADDRKRFSFRIADVAAADAFVDSLYLPGTPVARLDAAKHAARRWIGTDLGIPLRRLTAQFDR